MDSNNDLTQTEQLTSNPSYNDYLKAIAAGLAFSTISGFIIGLVLWGLDSIYEFIIFLTIVLSAMIPRGFLHKPHQLGTMLICAIVAFMNPFTIFLTMKTAGIEFEDSRYIKMLMILAPLLGLFFGFKKMKKS